MPRQEGSIGSNGNDDQTNYHHQPGGEDAHLINDIAWEIGSFIFHIYSWFEHIEIELLLMNPAVHECEDNMEQLKNMAVSIRSHKNRSRDVIDSLEILFNENEAVAKSNVNLATTIVIIKGKITDLEENIERVSMLVNRLGID